METACTSHGRKIFFSLVLLTKIQGKSAFGVKYKTGDLTSNLRCTTLGIKRNRKRLSRVSWKSYYKARHIRHGEDIEGQRRTGGREEGEGEEGMIGDCTVLERPRRKERRKTCSLSLFWTIHI